MPYALNRTGAPTEPLEACGEVSPGDHFARVLKRVLSSAENGSGPEAKRAKRSAKLQRSRSASSLDYSPRPANDRLPPSGPPPANQRVAARRMPYQFVNNPG